MLKSITSLLVSAFKKLSRGFEIFLFALDDFLISLGNSIYQGVIFLIFFEYRNLSIDFYLLCCLRIISRKIENFLMIMMCDYNVEGLRFEAMQWFFCTLFCACSIEFSYSYVHYIELVVDLFDAIMGFLGMPEIPTFTGPAPVFADLQPSVPELAAVEKGVDVEQEVVEEVLKEESWSEMPLLTLVCLGILTWAFFHANSGSL